MNYHNELKNDILNLVFWLVVIRKVEIHKFNMKLPRLKILYPLGQEVVSLTRNALGILLAGMER